MKKCFYCEREGVQQFVSLYMGDCTFEKKKRSDFTLTFCTNKPACEKRQAKLPKPEVIEGTVLQFKNNGTVKFIENDTNWTQPLYSFVSAVDQLKTETKQAEAALNNFKNEWLWTIQNSSTLLQSYPITSSNLSNLVITSTGSW